MAGKLSALVVHRRASDTGRTGRRAAEELVMERPAYVFSDLDEAECWRLLATVPIGRLGFTEAALPRVLPVHFTLRGEELVIASLNGSKVWSAGRGDIVAFEADSYDSRSREGGGVGVIGPSRLITDEEDIDCLDALDFAPWTADQGRHYFAVEPRVVFGRTLTRQPHAASVGRTAQAL
jgi:uncharacterized protein